MDEDMPKLCIYCSRHGQKNDYLNCIYQERKKDPLLCCLHRFSDEGQEKELHKSISLR